MRTSPILLTRAASAPAWCEPALPAWWPLADPGPDPVTGEPRPVLTEPERAARRRQKAQEEACRGPRDDDGRRRVVDYREEDGPPLVLEVDPGYVYRLSGKRGKVLVYRYDPTTSPGHAASIRAVEDGYAEAGPGYLARAVREGIAS